MSSYETEEMRLQREKERLEQELRERKEEERRRLSAVRAEADNFTASIRNEIDALKNDIERYKKNDIIFTDEENDKLSECLRDYIIISFIGGCTSDEVSERLSDAKSKAVEINMKRSEIKNELEKKIDARKHDETILKETRYTLDHKEGTEVNFDPFRNVDKILEEYDEMLRKAGTELNASLYSQALTEKYRLSIEETALYNSICGENDKEDLPDISFFNNNICDLDKYRNRIKLLTMEILKKQIIRETIIKTLKEMKITKINHVEVGGNSNSFLAFRENEKYRAEHFTIGNNGFVIYQQVETDFTDGEITKAELKEMTVSDEDISDQETHCKWSEEFRKKLEENGIELIKSNNAPPGTRKMFLHGVRVKNTAASAAAHKSVPKEKKMTAKRSDEK